MTIFRPLKRPDFEPVNGKKPKQEPEGFLRLLPILRYAYLKRVVERYRSPVSGSRATISLPLFSSRLAIWVAAYIAAPEEMPASSPSVFAMAREVRKASSPLTVNTSS